MSNRNNSPRSIVGFTYSEGNGTHYVFPLRENGFQRANTGLFTSPELGGTKTLAGVAEHLMGRYIGTEPDLSIISKETASLVAVSVIPVEKPQYIDVKISPE